MVNAHAADPSANILARMVRPEAPDLRADVARFFLGLDFSDAEKDRAAELAEKADAATLTEPERRELDGLVRVDTLLSMLHSKARRALRPAPADGA